MWTAHEKRRCRRGGATYWKKGPDIVPRCGGEKAGGHRAEYNLGWRPGYEGAESWMKGIMEGLSRPNVKRKAEKGGGTRGSRVDGGGLSAMT